MIFKEYKQDTLAENKVTKGWKKLKRQLALSWENIRDRLATTVMVGLGN